MSYNRASHQRTIHNEGIEKKGNRKGKNTTQADIITINICKEKCEQTNKMAFSICWMGSVGLFISQTLPLRSTNWRVGWGHNDICMVEPFKSMAIILYKLKAKWYNYKDHKIPLCKHGKSGTSKTQAWHTAVPDDDIWNFELQVLEWDTTKSPLFKFR